MQDRRAVSVNLGCRLNGAESDAMAGLAEAAGDAPVIVNTCAVTAEAVRQSRQAIRRAAGRHPGRSVVVTGCAAALEPERFASMPEVSRVIANGKKLDPASWTRALPPFGAEAPKPVRGAASLPKRDLDVRAPLAVQNGCDHRCTFCIIPFGRGDARSRPIADACADALALVERGAREVVLTGVDLTSWGPDLGEGLSLGHLVEALNEALPPQIWIRLSSIDGAEVDDRLFRLMTEVERIAPYAHLSLQAGSDMILKRMKRRHSRADAVHLCERLRKARPAMAFGADLIAGFPTETDAMFTETRALIRDCGLSYVHVFPFSPRVGTPAARMPQLPRPLVKERAATLREEADRALAAHLDGRAGQEAHVLIEELKDGLPLGRCADFTAVRLAEAGPRPGDIVTARMTARNGRRLDAVPLHQQP